MKKLMFIVVTGLVSLSAMARTDAEADAREMARDRAEASASQSQAIYLRDTLVKLSKDDPALEKTLRGLSQEDREKIIAANAVIYNAVVGARIRSTKE